MDDDKALCERLRSGKIMQAASDLIDRYFKKTDKVLASIPARPDVDADLVLTTGLRDAADRIEALAAEVERLREALANIAEGPPIMAGASTVATFQASIRQLTNAARADRLAKALEFYADYDDWIKFSQDAAASVFDRNFGSKLGNDMGDVARAALDEGADPATQGHRP